MLFLSIFYPLSKVSFNRAENINSCHLNTIAIVLKQNVENVLEHCLHKQENQKPSKSQKFQQIVRNVTALSFLVH